MPSRFASQLATLGFDFPEWCLPPSDELVRNYERQFALSLPSDYREFLVYHAGATGYTTCRFQEPTPCGDATCFDGFYGFTRPEADRHDDIQRCTKLIDGAPDVVAIGDNLIGAMFWLKCTGRDRGHVYMHDHEGRSAWPDEMFHQQFEALAPEIQGYLAMRKTGALPPKPKGYEHVYRMATSFTEFIARLELGEE